jgi:ribosomal protein S18 acetylase RimI-like enzyme
LISLSKLDKTALIRLAALHCAVMHTLLADLGPSLVLRYYEIAQTDPLVLGLSAISTDGKVLGWAIGSPKPAELNARLRQPFAWFANQMIRLATTRPIVFLELLSSVFSASDANQLQSMQIELTYIGVDPGVQGNGMGKAILTGFIDAARKAGYASIVLSVEIDNLPATALYIKSGFHITKTFSEGRFKRHRMEYLLN